MKLFTYEEQVRMALEEDMATRDDDRILTLWVWQTFYGVRWDSPVGLVMESKLLPSQETLGRCRRKLQQNDPSLRGSDHKENVRMKVQKDFIEYALSDTITDTM